MSSYTAHPGGRNDMSDCGSFTISDKQSNMEGLSKDNYK